MGKVDNQNLYLNDQAEVYNNLSFYFALLGSLILVGLAYVFVPNKLDIEYLRNTVLPEILRYSKSEANENTAYLAFIISFPIFYILINYYIRLKNKFIVQSDKFLKNIHIANITIIIALLIFINIVRGSYLATLDLFNNVPLSLIFYLLVTAGFILFLIRITKFDKCTKLANILILITGIFFIFHTASIFYVPAMYDYDAYHNEAYLYPIIKLMSGQIPLIDFTSIYGLYPYFFYPFLKIFGFTEMNISIFIMIQIFIIYSIFFYVLYSNCKNKFIALLGFLAIIFSSRYILGGGIGLSYLQYLPHRVIFPAIFLFLLIVHQQIASIFFKRVIYIVALIVSILSILWSTDSGIVVYLSFIIFFVFKNLQEYSLNDKTLYIKSLKHILLSLFSLILFMLLFYAFILHITGKAIDIKSSLYGISIFSLSGFAMLRLSSPDMWFLHIFVLLLALVKGLHSIQFMNLKNAITKEKSAIYFLFAIVGFGLFLYYQGRSHEEVFVLIMWQAILPLVLISDEYFAELVSSKRSLHYGYIAKFFKLYITILLLLTASIIAVMRTYQFSDYYSKMRADKYLESKPVNNIVDTVDKYIQANGATDLLITNASMVYHRLGLKYDLPLPARIDLFLLSDLDILMDYIERTDNNVAIESEYYGVLLARNPDRLDAIFNGRFEKPYEVQDILFFKKQRW